MDKLPLLREGKTSFIKGIFYGKNFCLAFNLLNFPPRPFIFKRGRRKYINHLSAKTMGSLLFTDIDQTFFFPSPIYYCLPWQFRIGLSRRTSNGYLQTWRWQALKTVILRLKLSWQEELFFLQIYSKRIQRKSDSERSRKISRKWDILWEFSTSWIRTV